MTDIITEGPFVGLKSAGYGLILADPPWAFQTFSDKGLEKSPQAHYPCLNLDDIKALPVADLAAKDCALIMWCISPMVEHAFQVVRAWGFEPKSFGAWAKQSTTGEKWAFGTGFLYRGAAEHWILATRGKPKATSKSVRNLIVSPVREHSRKPEQMRLDAQALFAGPYVELFAREWCPGWDGWGNEYGKFNPPSRGLKQSFADLGAALDGLRMIHHEANPDTPVNRLAGQACDRQPNGCGGGDAVGWAHIGMPGFCDECQAEALKVLT